MTSAIALDYLGCAVTVSGRADDLAWLREFLTPPFALSKAAARHRIAYTTDAARYAALRSRTSAAPERKIACFAFDQRDVEYPAWLGENGETVVFDDEFRSFYIVKGASGPIEVVAHRDDHWPRVALMRVVREIATAHAEANGALGVHGAAVAIGDGAAVFAGPKRSGKTSLLFHTLLHPRAKLVANDRLMVHRNGVDWKTTGMPTVISVRKGTRALFPEAFAAAVDDPTLASLSLRERQSYTGVGAGREDGALVLNPGQLCALAGVERTGAAAFKALVLPHVVPEHSGMSLTRLAPAAAVTRLPVTLFKPASRFFYTQGREPAFPAQTGLDDTFAAIAAAVPCFECILGENAYTGQSRSELLSRLLGSS